MPNVLSTRDLISRPDNMGETTTHIKGVKGLYYEAKTKALISCTVATQLICAPLFSHICKKQVFS